MRDYSRYGGQWSGWGGRQSQQWSGWGGRHGRHMMRGAWWMPLAFIFGFFLLTRTFWLIVPLMIFGALVFFVAPMAIRGLAWAAKTFNSSEAGQTWREQAGRMGEKAKFDNTYVPVRAEAEATDTEKPKHRPMYVIGDDGELIEVPRDESAPRRNLEPTQYV